MGEIDLGVEILRENPPSCPDGLCFFCPNRTNLEQDPPCTLWSNHLKEGLQ